MSREPVPVLGTSVALIRANSSEGFHDAMESATEQLLAHDEFCDVSFVCQDGEVVKANKADLAARSEFFDKLLYGQLRESNARTVQLPTAPGRAVRLLLGYLHTGDFNDTLIFEDVVDLLDLSDAWLLDSLHGKLKQTALRMMPDLAPAHKGMLMSWAVQHECEDMLQQIWLHMDTSKLQLKHLSSRAAVRFFLRDCPVRPGHECDILEAVCSWLQQEMLDNNGHAGEATAEVLQELLSYVRLEYVEADVLQKAEEIFADCGLRSEAFNLYKKQALSVHERILWCRSVSHYRLQWQACAGLEIRPSLQPGFAGRHPLTLEPEFANGKHCWHVHILVSFGCLSGCMKLGLTGSGEHRYHTCWGVESGTHRYHTDWGGQPGKGHHVAWGGEPGIGDLSSGRPDWNRTGAIITHYLDMVSHELWISIDGGTPRLVFTRLPARVQPIVHMMDTNGELLFQFRGW